MSVKSAAVQPSGPQQEAKENGMAAISFPMDEKEGEEMKKKIVEYSPQRRYVRFNEIIGKGAYKMVYRAYDTKEGLLVAWNTITLSGLPKHEKVRIMHEVRLLEQLDNGNIISFFGSWVNREKEEVVFITEILSSGSLKDFIRKVQVIRWKIIKRWCRQILKGLEYLHGHEPPIIHRDLKCDNIFINGSSGDLRIGDLGLSTYITGRTAPLSVLGTPEFMAPELYDEQYDVKVDVYAFGMCVLEMVSKETPYSECANAAQIYKRVTSQVPPQVLLRVRNERAREFILACLQQDPNARPSVSELLQHPFLLSKEEEDEEVVIDPPGKTCKDSVAPGPDRGHDGVCLQKGEKVEKPPVSLRPPGVSTGGEGGVHADGVSSVLSASPAMGRRGSSPLPPSTATNASHDAEPHQHPPDKSAKEPPRAPVVDRRPPAPSLSTSAGHTPATMSSGYPSVSSDLDQSDHDDHHHHHPPPSQHPRRPAATSNAGESDALGHSRRPSGGLPPQSGGGGAHEVVEHPHAPSFSRHNSDATDHTYDMMHSYQSSMDTAHPHIDYPPQQPAPLKVIPSSATMGTGSASTPSSIAAPTTVQVRSNCQQGGKRDVLCLVIRAKIQGKLRDIEFDFHLVDDDAYKVAQEMVMELGLPSSDLKDIAETIIKLAASARGARRSFDHRSGIPVPPMVDVTRSSSNNGADGTNMMSSYYAKAMGLPEPPLLRSYSTSHLPPVNNMIHVNSHHSTTGATTNQQHGGLDTSSTPLPHETHHSQSLVMKPSGGTDQGIAASSSHHNRTRTTGHIELSHDVNGHSGGMAPGVHNAPWDHQDEEGTRISPLASVVDDEDGVKYTLASEEELSPEDVEDAAYMKLRSEYEKNLNRVVKVHSLRMDNLKKAKEEKEECYRKQVERHHKDMVDFEKKVRTAEREQIKRLKQLEEDWRQTRNDYRGRRRPKSGSTATGPGGSSPPVSSGTGGDISSSSSRTAGEGGGGMDSS